MTPSTLIWGVKQSLREYIASAGGRVRTAGAGQGADGAFRFPAALLPEHDELRFEGLVEMTAHGGLLRIALENPRIAAETLYVEMDGWSLPVARLEARSMSLELAVHTTFLTADGADWLGGYYSVGQELDPLIVVAVDAEISSG